MDVWTDTDNSVLAPPYYLLSTQSNITNNFRFFIQYQAFLLALFWSQPTPKGTHLAAKCSTTCLLWCGAVQVAQNKQRNNELKFAEAAAFWEMQGQAVILHGVAPIWAAPFIVCIHIHC